MSAQQLRELQSLNKLKTLVNVLKYSKNSHLKLKNRLKKYLKMLQTRDLTLKLGKNSNLEDQNSFIIDLFYFKFIFNNFILKV